jgi:hypothetical protein
MAVIAVEGGVSKQGEQYGHAIQAVIPSVIPRKWKQIDPCCYFMQHATSLVARILANSDQGATRSTDQE